MSEIKKPDIYKMNLPADLKKLSIAQCENGILLVSFNSGACKDSKCKKDGFCCSAWKYQHSRLLYPSYVY